MARRKRTPHRRSAARAWSAIAPGEISRVHDVAVAELGSEPLREWIDFEVLHEDGSTIPIRAGGVALDGTDLVFFRSWRDQGACLWGLGSGSREPGCVPRAMTGRGR